MREKNIKDNYKTELHKDNGFTNSIKEAYTEFQGGHYEALQMTSDPVTLSFGINNIFDNIQTESSAWKESLDDLFKAQSIENRTKPGSNISSNSFNDTRLLKSPMINFGSNQNYINSPLESLHIKKKEPGIDTGTNKSYERPVLARDPYFDAVQDFQPASGNAASFPAGPVKEPDNAMTVNGGDDFNALRQSPGKLYLSNASEKIPFKNLDTVSINTMHINDTSPNEAIPGKESNNFAILDDFAIPSEEMKPFMSDTSDNARDFISPVSQELYSLQEESIPIHGYKESGGSVIAGKNYIVGEKGPEILSMGSTPGTIVSNEEIGTNKSFSLLINNNVNIVPGTGAANDNFVSQVKRALDELARHEFSAEAGLIEE